MYQRLKHQGLSQHMHVTEGSTSQQPDIIIISLALRVLTHTSPLMGFVFLEYHKKKYPKMERLIHHNLGEEYASSLTNIHKNSFMIHNSDFSGLHTPWDGTFQSFCGVFVLEKLLLKPCFLTEFFSSRRTGSLPHGHRPPSSSGLYTGPFQWALTHRLTTHAGLV